MLLLAEINLEILIALDKPLRVHLPVPTRCEVSEKNQDTPEAHPKHLLPPLPHPQ